MRASLGNSLLLNLVIVFASLVMLTFISILSYSKAYKVKNRIIVAIEDSGTYNETVAEQIAIDLHNIGYHTGYSNSECKKYAIDSNDKKYVLEPKPESSDFQYCVIKICNKKLNTSTGLYEDVCDADQGYYYKVITYVNYKFPIIESVFKIPVSSETKILGKTYNY